MKYPILVELENGKQTIINEEQVCTVTDDQNIAVVKMANGDELRVVKPAYPLWKNDALKRSD